MRTCTVLATGRILEAQSGDKPDFDALLKNAQAAGYSFEEVVCEVRPDAAVAAAFALQAALDAALQKLPAPSAVISRAAFRLRLIPAYLAIADLDEKVQRKWAGVLSILNDFDSISLDDPAVQGLVQLAVADAVLTKDQAAAVLAVPAVAAKEMKLAAQRAGNQKLSVK